MRRQWNTSWWWMLCALLAFHWSVGCTSSSCSGLLLCLAAFSITEFNTNNNSNNLLILGLGRVGKEVTRQIITSQPLDDYDTSGIGISDGITSSSSSSFRFQNIFGTVRDMKDDTEFVVTDDTKLQGCVRTQRLLWSNRQDILDAAKVCTHVLVTIPPNKDSDVNNDINCMFDLVMQELFVSTRASCCPWVGIVSTTGVYGNHNGAWVTEQTPPSCVASTDTSANRYLVYEEAWKERLDAALAFATAGKPDSLIGSSSSTSHQQPSYRLRIFRCAGIYGPDQSALHTVYKNGGLLPMSRRESSQEPDNNIPTNQDDTATIATDVTNRIHVTDLAAAIVSSMRQHNGIMAAEESKNNDDTNIMYYNLADNAPESRAVVMRYAMELLQSHGISFLPSKTTETSDTSTRSQRRQLDQKRVSNDRMRNDLLPILKYPTYKEGLSAIAEDRKNPWWQ